MSARRHQQFNSRRRATQPPGVMSRDSQSLCNQSCQNILYKSVFEHFSELPNVAALLLASKSLQNSSFGANFLINFKIDDYSIRLLDSVMSPSSCLSLQFVPSLHVTIAIYSFLLDSAISNFVAELVHTKYLPLQLESVVLENVSEIFLSRFFGNNGFSRLRTLVLLRSKITRDAMAAICEAAQHQLSCLNVESCDGLSAFSLEHISKLSNNITSLSLSHNNVTSAGLEHVSALSNLTSLNLNSGREITDAGLEHLVKLSNMVSLNLGCNKNITDAGLESVAKLSRLTFLDLSRCEKITVVGLGFISSLSGITTLDLSGCDRITDAGLERIAKLSAIVSLDLFGCDNLTAAGIEYLSSIIPLATVIHSFGDVI